MKKLLYLLPVAAVAMASCTNDDNALVQKIDEVAVTTPAEELNGDQLIMRPAVQGASTRYDADAYYPTTTALKEFHIDITGDFRKTKEETTEATNLVTAFHEDLVSSNDVKLTWKDGDANDQLYYWNSRTTVATFSAYAPTDFDFTSHTVSLKRSEQKDPIIAYNEGTKAQFKNGVPLYFRHMMSQVMVKATNKDYENVDINVRAIRLANIASTGTPQKVAVSTIDGFTWDKAGGVWPWGVTLSNPLQYNSFKDGDQPSNYGDSEIKSDDGNNSGVQLAQNALDITFGDPFYLLPQQLSNAVVSPTPNSDTKGTGVGQYADDDSKPTELAPWAAKYRFASGNALELLIQVKDKKGTPIAPVYQSGYTNVTSIPVEGNTFDLASSNLTQAAVNVLTNGVYFIKEAGNHYSALDATIFDNHNFNTETLKLEDLLTNAVGSSDQKLYSSNATQGYMWVYVPLDTNWEPGKKYIYTLNFAEDAYGLVSPAQAAGGTWDPMDTTPGEDSAEDVEKVSDPGEPVIDNDVQLTFTVQVTDWEEVNINRDDM